MDTSTKELKNSTPVVSVCMVTYNREDFIAEAIDSVLMQDYVDWELIIVDDASTDRTRAVVEKFNDPRIRYYQNKTNQDVSRARNTALAHVLGKFVAVIDSDDVWIDPEKLSKQVRYLSRESDVVLVGTRAVTINGAGEGMEHLKNPVGDKDIRKVMLRKNPFVHSSVMFRYQQVRDMGGYNEDYTTSEDYELFLRLGKVGKFINFPRYMVGYRMHSGNIIVSRRASAMKISVRIVLSFRNEYPHFYSAFVRRLVRYVGYFIFASFGVIK